MLCSCSHRSPSLTVASLMLFADRRELSIDDAGARFIAEFKGGDRPGVLVRHLLSHTSALHEMLPENEELRRRHAPVLPSPVSGVRIC